MGHPDGRGRDVLVPMMAMMWGTPIYVLDIKDAYLTVEQPEDEPVVITSPASWYKRHGTHKQWKLGRVLPGQRRGAQEWYSKFNRDLRANHLEPMLEAPTLYRHLAGQFAAQLHVDDMLSSGVAELGEPLYANLKEQYTVKIAGPFSKPGDEFEFLKRRYCIEENGSITVRPALRFYYDIWELAGKPKTRSTPGPQDMVFGVDDSELLKSNQATDFRTIVGKLLYISNERPDAQVVIQYLASRASSPTVTSKRVVEHLAGYLWATQGHGINLCPCQGRSVMRAEGSSDPGGDQPQGHSSTAKHLIEAVSDSNFANDKATRRSLSSGQLYVNGALAFSFVRSQKVVTTSSGEAELVALTQTVGEAVLLRKALAFLEGVRDVDVELVARTDSSVARAIAARSGVGRVKHLATSCLWLQGWVARKELRVAAIPTEVNPADVGTKVLAARRLAMLLFILGMVGENGERVGRREFEERATRQGLRQRNVMRLAQMLVAMQLQGCSGESEGTADTVEGILVKFAFFLEYVMTMIAGNPEIMLCIAVVVLFLAALFVGSQFQWTLKLEVSNNKGLEPATKVPQQKVYGTGRAKARTRAGQREPNEGQREPNEGPREPDEGPREPDEGPREPDEGPREPGHGTGRQSHSARVLERGGAAARQWAQEALGSEIPSSSGDDRASQFSAGRVPGPAVRSGVPTSSTRESAKAKPMARRSRLVIAPGARQDPEIREGGEALVMSLTDMVLYAPTRGYAFHLVTCRNVRGSAKQTRQCTVAEALDLGLHPGQCCTGGRMEVV